jgi:hypothetical protein
MVSQAFPVLLVVAAASASALVTQKAKLQAAGSLGFDELGYSVAIERDTVFAGARRRGTGDAGAAFVFKRDGNGTWTQVTEIAASNPDSGDFFGSAVAVFGDTALVGAIHATKPSHGFGRVDGLAFDAASGTLYGSDSTSDQLVIFDAETGTATAVGALGFDQVRGLAFHSGSGTLLGSDVQTDQLLSIDTASGAATPIGPTGFGDVTGLAYDPVADVLYGMNVPTNELITLDPASGAGSAVGVVGVVGVRGLAYDANAGVLYGNGIGSQSAQKLVSIDTATGVGTKLGNLGFQLVDGLAHDAAGDVLYGSDTGADQLLSIDSVTAQATPLSGAVAQDSGAVYVFERDEGGADAWGELAVFSSSEALTGDRFGGSMSLDGPTAVVAAWSHPTDGLSGAGAAYLFERAPAGHFVETVRLTSNAPRAGDTFGSSLALEGDRAVVGVEGDDHSAVASAGSVFVFERDRGGPGLWGQAAMLVANDPKTNDWLGTSVALSGDTIVAGARGVDAFAMARVGAAYVFERDAGGPGNWGQVVKLPSPDPGEHDEFGHSVAISGDSILVGAPQDNYNAMGNAGSAYLFQRDAAGNWVYIEKFTHVAPAGDDWFGSAMAMWCETAVIGAYQEDKNPGIWQDDGAAFVFEVTPVPPDSYCTAGTTASGCQALVSASGKASVSMASGFDVTVAGAEGQKDGTIYFSTNGAQANAWGNGTSYQCVVPPVTRTGVLQGSGAPATCGGLFELDFNAWMAANPGKAPAPGDATYLQCWFRDPQNTSNRSTSLSDALRFVVCP